MGYFDNVMNVNIILDLTLVQTQLNMGPKAIIKGYLKDMFTTGGSNNWGELVTQDGAVSAANAFLMKANYKNVLMYINDTLARWQGAEIPRFEVSFYLYATNKSIKPLDIVKPLYACTYPIPVSGNSGGIEYKYHLGFAPNYMNLEGRDNNVIQGKTNTSEAGTAILSIGDWFYAPSLLVESVSVQNSVEQIDYIGSSGVVESKPVYALVQVTMRPTRLPTATEFLSYFSKSPVTGG
jgi:hypothetical protein